MIPTKTNRYVRFFFLVKSFWLSKQASFKREVQNDKDHSSPKLLGSREHINIITLGCIAESVWERLFLSVQHFEMKFSENNLLSSLTVLIVFLWCFWSHLKPIPVNFSFTVIWRNLINLILTDCRETKLLYIHGTATTTQVNGFYMLIATYHGNTRSATVSPVMFKINKETKRK